MCKLYLFLVLSLVFIFLGCELEKVDVVGCYVAENNIINTDSLVLFEEGIYERKLYRKSDKKIILEHSGKWSIKDGKMVLNDFFIDLDRVYSPDRKFNSSFINCSFHIETDLKGRTFFKYGYFDEEKYTYYKQ